MLKIATYSIFGPKCKVFENFKFEFALWISINKQHCCKNSIHVSLYKHRLKENLT